MIIIEKKVYEVLIQHMKKGYPNEACGILAGPPAETKATVFFPMKNLDESSISYFMDPKEQLTVFKKMRELGLEMKGILHSHVASEAAPSQKDIRLAFYADVSYLIISLSDMRQPVLRSFQIKDETVTEEEVRVV
jgi:[CysO sulfur-carrier protein]-S-L-cysteine hydrolase